MTSPAPTTRVAAGDSRRPSETIRHLASRALAPGPRLAATVSLATLVVLAALVFWRQLFDHWTFTWDFLGAYTTTPAFVAASVSGGHLFSWSSYVASGFPTAVDPQAGMYFPGWWALGTLGIPATLRVLTVVQVAHVLFGAVGVLALARARRLSWSWATLAAVAFLLFGGFYGESEHADIVRGFAYVPWLLWALTPPGGTDVRWLRLLALPPIVWLIATGAYPGQLVSFALTGFVYLAVALATEGRGVIRRHRWPLLLAIGSSAAVCLAVLLPYLRAEQAHELHRVLEPTAAARAGESLGLRDLLGSYLNTFAWAYDGTVTSWAVGVPVLIGLACARRETLRRHAPLVACGALALLLAMTPKVGFVGKAMTSFKPLFPSRFPAADYKAVIAVAFVVLAADAWSRLDLSRRSARWTSAALAVLLVLGATLASHRYAPLTRELWLLIVVIAACTALVLVRIPARALVIVLIALAIVDGVRTSHDYRLLGRTSSWQVPATEAAQFLGRDGLVRTLGKRLEQAPATRPARIAPVAPLVTAPTGTNNDATGWVADGYHLVDYGGTIENSLWRVEHSSAWLSLMLAPWHAYTFPCSGRQCTTTLAALPAPSRWRVSSEVRTLSYATNRITYAVSLARPALMIENELSIPGWHAGSSHVRPVRTRLPLRAWRLAAGTYTFATSYRDPERTAQELVAIAALLAWLAGILVLWRPLALRRVLRRR
ncbi:MAG TPA: hypothetical protein VGH09_03190 [Solirubrobacteraceae bacterium]|jgi:hypothetical protein